MSLITATSTVMKISVFMNQELSLITYKENIVLSRPELFVVQNLIAFASTQRHKLTPVSTMHKKSGIPVS